MKTARRLGIFGGIVVAAGMLGAPAVFGAGSAYAIQVDPGAAAERALDAQGPILTPDEEAMIEAKCGYGPREWNGRNIRMEENGVLVCSNGRRVDDPEVRALAGRIEQRVETRVRTVMNDPEVRAAMSGEIQARVREQMRDIQPRIEAAMRDAEVARARADIAVRHAETAAARAEAHARVKAEFGPAEQARLRSELERVRADIDRIDFDAIDREVEAALERDLGRLAPAH